MSIPSTNDAQQSPQQQVQTNTHGFISYTHASWLAYPLCGPTCKATFEHAGHFGTYCWRAALAGTRNTCVILIPNSGPLGPILSSRSSSVAVFLEQPQSTKSRWGKRQLMWLSPLENMRLNTVRSWPQVSQSVLWGWSCPCWSQWNVVWFCWLLSKWFPHSGIEFTMSIKSLLHYAGMTATMFSILFVMALVGF